MYIFIIFFIIYTHFTRPIFTFIIYELYINNHQFVFISTFTKMVKVKVRFTFLCWNKVNTKFCWLNKPSVTKYICRFKMPFVSFLSGSFIYFWCSLSYRPNDSYLSDCWCTFLFRLSSSEYWLYNLCLTWRYHRWLYCLINPEVTIIEWMEII